MRTSCLPLLSGYVFVLVLKEDRHHVVATGCISNPAELNSDLRRIQLLNQPGADVRPEAKPLIGRHAVVTSGPLTGVEGTVAREHSHHRLTVVVTFMQQGASVVFDQTDIEFID
jgi:hypothetical protein